MSTTLCALFDLVTIDANTYKNLTTNFVSILKKLLSIDFQSFFLLPLDFCTFHSGTQLIAQEELEIHIFVVHKLINSNASIVEAFLDFECCLGWFGIC